MDYTRFATKFASDFLGTIPRYKQAVEFIHENKLWKGWNKYGWMPWLLIAVGLFVGFRFLLVILNGFSNVASTETVGLASGIIGIAGDIFKEGYNLFFLGGMKYIILILMEIVIFHFVRKTIEILTGKLQAVTFRDFINAEIRMIKVVLIAWLSETIITFVLKLILSIFGLKLLMMPVTIGVQSFFLGYVVLDNYYEVFGLSIKEARNQIRNHAGISTAVGLGMYILLAIPLIGALLAPIIGAVTGTLAIHGSQSEESFIKEPVLDTEAQLI